MNNSELRARRDILIQTQAQIAASQVPGLEISLSDDGYAIRHSIDDSFDLEGIHLEGLLVAVKCVVDALEGRYGPGGNLLGEAMLSCGINSRPV